MKITSLDEAKRAAFRGAWRGLEWQGWRRAIVNGCCAIRGAEGRRCAVGWLVRDERLTPDMLQGVNSGGPYSASSLGAFAVPLQAWLNGVAAPSEREAFLHFLSELQEAHDDGRSPEQMRGRMEAIRAGLGEPVPQPLCPPRASL